MWRRLINEFGSLTRAALWLAAVALGMTLVGAVAILLITGFTAVLGAVAGPLALAAMLIAVTAVVIIAF